MTRSALFFRLFASLSLSVAALACQRVLSPDPNIPTTFEFSRWTAHRTDEEEKCMLVPGSSSEIYQLTFLSDKKGEYEVRWYVGNSRTAASWTGRVAEGRHICAPGDSTVDFYEFPLFSTVTVTAEISNEEDCASGVIPKVDISTFTGAHWSDYFYYLWADYFGYTVVGEDTVTMANGTNIDMWGNSYNRHNAQDNNMSITIKWDIDGKEKRFSAKFGSSAYNFQTGTTAWNMYEARVYNNAETWESFYELAGVLNGTHFECFTQDTLVITNDAGSEIRFENLTLAAFLFDWRNYSAKEECVMMGGPGEESNGSGMSLSIYATFFGMLLGGLFVLM